jgi:hypothetical protein
MYTGGGRGFAENEIVNLSLGSVYGLPVYLERAGGLIRVYSISLQGWCSRLLD